MKILLLKLPFILYDMKYKLGTRLGGTALILLFFFPLIQKRRRFEYLLAANRANYSKLSAHLIRTHIDEISHILQEETNTASKEATNAILARSIILKKPLFNDQLCIEKGVVLVKFSETFVLYLKHVNCELLFKEYHLILEPSWTGHALEEILGWCKYRNHKVYLQTADVPDHDFIKSLNSNLVPMRIGSGEFVDYRIFNPSGSAKEYHTLCVANSLHYKRVYAYLAMVKKILAVRPNFKAALVCANRGHHKEHIKKLIHLMSLSESLEFIEHVSQDKLNAIMDRSCLNILMSYREGSNRVLFETLFADIPSVLLKNNIGINKDCFNPNTGKAVDEKNLTADVLDILDNIQKFTPRAWALANISPEISTKKMIETIQNTEYGGKKFTMPYYVKVNNPEASYMHKYDDMNSDICIQLLKKYLK